MNLAVLPFHVHAGAEPMRHLADDPNPFKSNSAARGARFQRFRAAPRSLPQALPHIRPTGFQSQAPAARTSLPSAALSLNSLGKRLRTSFHFLNRGSFSAGTGSCAISRNWDTKDSAKEL